jgi:ribosomal protein S18 acetylase RimI-like enzyme
MSRDHYERWLPVTMREYADEKVKAGNYDPDTAMEQAQAEFDKLLPQGLGSAGHELTSIIDDAGEIVGHCWFPIEDRPVGRVVFIYDIAIDPAHRRKGHAQAALAGVEDYAREHGCIGVMLHVFGSNAGARALYQKAGYEETNVIMLKRVDA